ncbi:hypothetical protein EYF80_041231 [Liparis tanakae]|uniref:Uncharacterized protein n=1 Tax=Liparis tanakae TaxID=230148 RepID=A0A4Z2G4Y4_9TELE|nr:hypothetical protein EYF80_041231 [Liparis tanakae]
MTVHTYSLTHRQQPEMMVDPSRRGNSVHSAAVKDGDLLEQKDQLLEEVKKCLPGMFHELDFNEASPGPSPVSEQRHRPPASGALLVFNPRRVVRCIRLSSQVKIKAQASDCSED